MATNLVQLVLQQLTPDMITKIATMLGLDRAIAQKMISGAVPSLLAGFADVASTPAGAGQFANALTQQPSGSLDNVLANLARGSGTDSLASAGSSMLSGLFGGSALDTMSQVIGEFSGTSKGTGKTLLGILGPMVLGALGLHARSAGLDAGGLASLLTSQRQQITSAIPSGLADRLTAKGLLDDAEQGAAAAAGRVSSAARSQASNAGARVSGMPWAYWVLGAVVLGGLAWYVLGTSRDTVAELPRPAASPPTATVGVAPSDITIGNLTNRINSSVDSLKSVLPGITDAASAQSALPKLKEATTQFGEIGILANRLPPESRSALAKLVAAAMPAINEMCDKVVGTPGVGAVAKPTIDELRSKLNALSQA
ncbi:MAG: DUF937 domain-containing protein [Bradyrhizobium sp.]|nr:DUF937 domain-containing protein [Bradyrhizobium sp.]